MLTQKDLQQINAKNISEEQIQWQITQFKDGVAPINLDRHAAIADGILKIDDVSSYIQLFDNSAVEITKFVPASGAASRMFKALFQALSDLESGKTEADVITNDKNVNQFYTEIQHFAFYQELLDVIKANNEKVSLKSYLKYLLDDTYMGYGSLPKGLLKFHHYDSFVRTPFEEHLVEGALYGKDKNNVVKLHFTVSPEHEEKFKELFDTVKEKYEKEYNVHYQISFSTQNPSTDTMSVTPSNEPFRNDDGTILFRPGGHGALIQNLEQINSDIIFIKNIDNVVPESIVKDTVTYKKVLAGVLLSIRDKIFEYQKAIDEGLNENTLEEIIQFYKAILFVDYKPTLSGFSSNEQESFFKEILFRPIRVCGIVKNIGEPGGGPFWVKSTEGILSLQIVESSQVNMKDTLQKTVFEKSTHFNPVDLVCAVKNYKGEKYTLPDFVDQTTCFISKKSKDGKDLKALELPGLWNGAMAKWNTVFVEVPISTFNPVKTVNDLLREQHQ